MAGPTRHPAVLEAKLDTCPLDGVLNIFAHWHRPADPVGLDLKLKAVCVRQSAGTGERVKDPLHTALIGGAEFDDHGGFAGHDVGSAGLNLQQPTVPTSSPASASAACLTSPTSAEAAMARRAGPP